MATATLPSTPTNEEIPFDLIRRDRKRSNIGVAVAMVATVVAFLLWVQPSSIQYLGPVLGVLSVPVWFYGLAYYAKAKGYSFGWAALGFLGFTGLIILALLPDRYKPRGAKMRWTGKLIIGLLIFMAFWIAFVSFMASRTDSQTPDFRETARIMMSPA